VDRHVVEQLLARVGQYGWDKREGRRHHDGTGGDGKYATVTDA
jgi:hypothetical protein